MSVKRVEFFSDIFLVFSWYFSKRSFRLFCLQGPSRQGQGICEQREQIPNHH